MKLQLNDPPTAQMHYSPHKKGLFQDAKVLACRCEVEVHHFDLSFITILMIAYTTIILLF